MAHLKKNNFRRLCLHSNVYKGVVIGDSPETVQKPRVWISRPKMMRRSSSHLIFKGHFELTRFRGPLIFHWENRPSQDGDPSFLVEGVSGAKTQTSLSSFFPASYQVSPWDESNQKPGGEGIHWYPPKNTEDKGGKWPEVTHQRHQPVLKKVALWFQMFLLSAPSLTLRSPPWRTSKAPQTHQVLWVVHSLGQSRAVCL